MNPGPETWQLSTCNPTGLTGKAAQFATLAPGIAAVSESHLTEPRFSSISQRIGRNEESFCSHAQSPSSVPCQCS